jgi:hypothetical protein
MRLLASIHRVSAVRKKDAAKKLSLTTIVMYYVICKAGIFLREMFRVCSARISSQGYQFSQHLGLLGILRTTLATSQQWKKIKAKNVE